GSIHLDRKRINRKRKNRNDRYISRNKRKRNERRNINHGSTKPSPLGDLLKNKKEESHVNTME
uniref:Uncharacterized protein n=1 Tax=Cucumis melo TaxID=3656 RepID=A0A9I9EL68_CUCME